MKPKFDSEVKQLRRIAGQIRAVERMIYSQAEFIDVIQQLEAARCSLKSLVIKLISNQLKKSGAKDISSCLYYLTKLK